MAIEPSPSAPATVREDTVWGMVISLLFWLCLLSASVLFALVALSPKLVTSLQLRSQFEANQLRLVALERQGQHVKRVIEAMRTDKEFAAELTRVEFDAVRPGEELIAVDPSLKLNTQPLESSAPATDPHSAWYEPVIKFLASDSGVRKTLLWVAGVLVVISFSMLQPAGTGEGAVRGGNVLWRNLRERYDRSLPAR